MDQRRTGQRPEQRRNQRDIRHHGRDFNTHRLFEGFLYRGIADRADKAQADALQETHHHKLFNVLYEQNGQTGDDEKAHARQHDRTTPAPV
ncbi:hypothetical protein SRABI106_02011 [Rahnella aquatilis]|nr:hypothetical protein SRABI106_02011 [Rahnella aquatilis]